MCMCNAPLKNIAFCTLCGAINKVELPSPFVSFNLPDTFFLDNNELKKTYLILQNKFHPDRFSQNIEERKKAEEYAAYINASYQALKDPLKRAELLLKHYPENLSDEILLQEMENQEYLETLYSQTELDLFKEKILRKKEEVEQEMADFFHQKKYNKAKNSLVRLKYLYRLLEEIFQKSERLFPC